MDTPTDVERGMFDAFMLGIGIVSYLRKNPGTSYIDILEDLADGTMTLYDPGDLQKYMSGEPAKTLVAEANRAFARDRTVAQKIRKVTRWKSRDDVVD